MADSTAESVDRLTTDWKVQGSDPGGGEIFRTYPDQPWCSPSLLYNGCRVSFPGVKWLGWGADHPPYSSAGVEYVQSYTSTYYLCLLGM
jgi:hypothetical protein